MDTRIASRNDLAAIVEIYNHAVAAEATADLDPTTVEARRAWFDAHVPHRRPILVTTIADTVVGWASLSDYRPPRAALRYSAEISYYVHPSQQRQGIGTHLMHAAIARCPALRIKTLFAILLADNAPSIGLLKKCGFEQWGCLPNVADFHGREVDHVYYGRRIE